MLQAVETTSMTVGSRCIRRLFDPIDIGLIVFFRILFGLVMMYEVSRYITRGWIERDFVAPVFHFTYYGFSWITPWSGNGMQLHFYALGLLAFLMTVGLFYRVASVLFFLGFTYVFLLDQTYYLNHFYLVVLLSLTSIFLPANRSFSLDVIARPRIRSETVPAWTLWLLRLQIGIVYFYGGLAKLCGDWLNGSSIRLMLSRRTDFPYIGQYFGEEWMVMSFTWIGLLFDLLVVPMLLWRRTRMMAYFLAVLFHLTNAKLFDIGIFPLLMVAASMLFFPPDTLRNPQEGDTPALKKPSVAFTTPLTMLQKWTVWSLGVYVAFQLLFPFRHFLYPGDVNWTDEGHRFAWRMKLRIKSSSQAELYAVDGSGFQIPEAAITEDVLTARQRRVMSGRPDMLLQYAHFLADRFEQEQHQPADIRANVAVSLNGREPQRLIDPTVNLAERKRTLWPSDWILPLADSVPQPPNR